MEQTKERFYNMEMKSVLKNIHDYAKRHMALFLGLCAGMVSVISLIAKLALYCYQVGYYSYFGVNMSWLSVANDNDFMSLMFYIAVTCFIIFLNLWGYLFYRQNRLLKWMFVLYLVIVGCLAFVFVRTMDWKELAQEFGMMSKTIFILPMLLIVLLHAPLISCILISGKRDKINRLENKLYRLKKKGKTTSKSYEKIRQTLLSMKADSASENDNAESLHKSKTSPFLYVLFSIGCFSMILIMILMFGWLQATEQTSFSIIPVKQMGKDVDMPDIQDVFSDTEKEPNAFVILYQNTNFLVIAPCYTDNNSLLIFEKFQTKIILNHQFVEKSYYQNVVLK